MSHLIPRAVGAQNLHPAVAVDLEQTVVRGAALERHVDDLDRRSGRS